MRKTIIMKLALGVAIGSVSACSAADGSSPTPQPSPTAQTQSMEETVIWINSDGSANKVERRSITRDEFDKMNAEMAELEAAKARGEQFTVTLQSPCMTSSNWFFSETTCNVSGAFLCLVGTGGPVDLSNIDPSHNWANAIKAYITWESVGSMGSTNGGANCNQFGRTQSCTSWSHTSTSSFEWQPSTTC